MRDTEAASDRATRTPIRSRTILWSLWVGILVGCAGALAIAPPRGARFEARLAWSAGLPAARDWPHAARAGETARLEAREDGIDLVVTAGSAASARRLTRAFAARHAPSSSDLAAAYARTRQSWRAADSAPAKATRTRNAACAAVLLARTQWGRDLARDLPLASPSRPTPEESAPPDVEDAWLNVTWVVDDRDATVLLSAVVEATRLETRWFADSLVWSGWLPTARADAWRRWQRSRARLLEPIRQQLLAWESAAQQEFATRASAASLVALDNRVGNPWAAFAKHDVPPARPLVRPIASVWLPPLLVGAGAGSLGALFALVLAAIFQPALPRPREMRPRASELELGAASPSLHVVTGPKPAAVLRAALELAAHRLAVGERVLLVDASPRLRLHERLGRDARWGLLECLVADMPVLGLVQYAGHPGLYLLPHGKAERAVGWSPLGRKLDEVLPHFARIILAVEPLAPAALGDALRGRAMEGWWAGDERGRDRTLESATARLGIAFSPLQMESLLDASLEALAERVLGLRPPGPAPEPAPITAAVLVEPRPVPGPVLEPIVLDCDLQVRQRLRFLAWMRRVQSEERRAEVRV